MPAAGQVTVRRGDYVVHCSLAQLQSVIEALESSLPAAAGDPALLAFPEELAESAGVAKPGEALQLLDKVADRALVNEARGLLRARGAACHKVPQGRAARVLRQARGALCSAGGSSSGSSGNSVSTRACSGHRGGDSSGGGSGNGPLGEAAPVRPPALAEPAADAAHTCRPPGGGGGGGGGYGGYWAHWVDSVMREFDPDNHYNGWDDAAGDQGSTSESHAAGLLPAGPRLQPRGSSPPSDGGAHSDEELGGEEVPQDDNFSGSALCAGGGGPSAAGPTGPGVAVPGSHTVSLPNREEDSDNVEQKGEAKPRFTPEVVGRCLAHASNADLRKLCKSYGLSCAGNRRKLMDLAVKAVASDDGS